MGYAIRQVRLRYITSRPFVLVAARLSYATCSLTSFHGGVSGKERRHQVAGALAALERTPLQLPFRFDLYRHHPLCFFISIDKSAYFYLDYFQLESRTKSKQTNRAEPNRPRFASYLFNSRRSQSSLLQLNSFNKNISAQIG